SCASFTFLAIKTFVAAGSLRQGQEVFAGVRYGATHLTGDGATTQGAHRVHGGVWVRFRPGDPRYDAVRADGRRSPQADGSIVAALPAAALSRLGWKIAIEPMRAVTLLGTRFNQVNTFTETHGEKDAYSRLVQFAAQSAPAPPKVVALDARALVMGQLLPASIRATEDALLHYKGQLKKSGLS